MSATGSASSGGTPQPALEAGGQGRGVGRLGPALAWAVVFCPLGTSVYYVPGMLYGQVGPLAPAFVLLATVAFVLVAVEHLEITTRYPRGGGGVAAAIEAFGTRFGVLSGALMVSAYVLTMVISTVTAFHYISAIGKFRHEVGILSAVAIVCLGVINWIGVRGAARVALLAAIAALAVDLVLVGRVIAVQGFAPWSSMFAKVGHLPSLPWHQISVGFAGAWLAYSGLESLGQLAPAIRRPRPRVIRIATAMLIGSVLATAPLFTALAIDAAADAPPVKQVALLAPVAAQFGGRSLLVALSLTAAALLLLAAHLAFVSCYSVFQVIGELGYLPAAVARRHPRTGTPHGAVIVIALGALALVAVTAADLNRLGRLFAFGLLGSYSITSVAIDVLRWRERRLGVSFALGVLASAALVVPWVSSWFSRPWATVYGSIAAGSLLLVALVTHRGWIRAGQFGYVRAETAEEAAGQLPGASELVTLGEAVAEKALTPSTTMVALRTPNQALCTEVARRARGVGDTAVVVVYVDEVPGLFFPSAAGPSAEARRVLRAAVADLDKEGMAAVPLWRLAHDAGASIAEAAEELRVNCVFVGTTQRSAVWHFLRGDVLKRLIDELPDDVHVVICE